MRSDFVLVRAVNIEKFYVFVNCCKVISFTCLNFTLLSEGQPECVQSSVDVRGHGSEARRDARSPPALVGPLCLSRHAVRLRGVRGEAFQAF